MDSVGKTGKQTGLSAVQVEESRNTHGANVLTPPERDPWWKLFLEKFEDPVIRILMIAAFIAIAVGIAHGNVIEGLGIVVAILLATTLAFINEYKAAKEFDILNQVNDEVPIKVIRDGDYTTVPRKDLVVGDVVLVEVGEEMPADGQVIEAVSFQVDESRLTGESVPVNKRPLDPAKPASGHELAYPLDKVLRGTTVVDGHAVLVISAVGDHTEIGQTARAAAEETGEETPLNQQLSRLSKAIGVIGFGIAALTFAALVLRGALLGELGVSDAKSWVFIGFVILGVMIAAVRIWLPIVYDGFELAGKEKEPPAWLEAEGLMPWLKTIGLGAAVFAVLAGVGWLVGLIPGTFSQWLPEAASTALLQFFMIAVTIIVVAVPEGLAMSVTLSLAYSMRKMTATNNLVRKMHACETIGAATVICSDKTGTLTMNEMRVFEVAFPAASAEAFTKDTNHEAAKLVAEGISANSTANLSRKTGERASGLGNPTECALLLWLDENKLDYVIARDRFEVEYQWVFSTERKFMATLGKSAVTGNRLLHVKGAPELVLARCTQVMTANGSQPVDQHRAAIEASLKDYQARGMRTLGFAIHSDCGQGADIEQIANGLTWLGFVAISDPIRQEVPSAIKACRDAGIEVKIITGDNSETAKEIGRQIGLIEGQPKEQEHMTGTQFGELNDEEAHKAIEGIHLLSRARPLDKLRFVRLLQDNGHVVAVTGDGTNDAPALNYANVGLSMGKTGTSVAKEASDIVLLDDSFKSIVNAVLWGRSLYQNIQRFILFQLTINVAALVIALLGPFIGVQLPLTVIQMLWVNLIMDTFAALALAAEPPDWGVMQRPPRKASDFIVSGPMAKNIFGVAGVFLAILIAFLLIIQATPAPIGSDILSGNVTRHEASLFFTTFVMLQFWNLFNARRLGSNEPAFKGMSQNRGFLLIAGAIFIGQVVITQFGGEVFRTAPLSILEWIIVVGSTSFVLWIGEFVRWRQRSAEAGVALQPGPNPA
ncbi:MAG: calcium-translocating P-type ATPase, PMCA-type [Phycisphaeraceae bacterium]